MFRKISNISNTYLSRKTLREGISAHPGEFDNRKKYASNHKTETIAVRTEIGDMQGAKRLTKLSNYSVDEGSINCVTAALHNDTEGAITCNMEGEISVQNASVNTKCESEPKQIIIQPKEEGAQIMHSVIRYLSQRHNERILLNVFSKVQCRKIEGNTMYIAVDSHITRNLIYSNYLDDILLYFHDQSIGIDLVKVEVKSDNLISDDHLLNNHLTDQSHTSQEAQCEILGSHTNKLLSFENFTYNTSNVVAFRYAKQIAKNYTLEKEGISSSEEEQQQVIQQQVIQNNKKRSTINKQKYAQSLNKLYLYSDVGMGKSHLLQSIANNIHAVYNDNTTITAKTLYITAEKFIQEYITSVKGKYTTDFRQKMTELDVLLLDDFQLICGKTATEKEFLTIFDTLIASGKKVVIAADRKPYDLSLSKRAQSRLSSCAMVAIQESDLDLRMRILQKKATTMKCRIPTNILELIAKNVVISVRELESVLHKVVMHSSVLDEEIDINTAYDILSDHCREIDYKECSYYNNEKASNRIYISKHR